MDKLRQWYDRIDWKLLDRQVRRLGEDLGQVGIWNMLQDLMDVHDEEEERARREPPATISDGSGVGKEVRP